MIVDAFPYCIQTINSLDISDPTLSGLLSGVFSAVIGGVLTGLFSLVAVGKQVKSTRQIDRERLEEEIDGIIQAIYDEITTVYKAYEQSIGVLVEALKQKEIFTTYYYVTEDYFTIYNSNASVIEKISDRELRSLIVETYCKAKMLLDVFELNNNILSRHHELVILSYKAKDEYDMALASREETKLIVNATAIRKRHNDLKICINRLIQHIEKRSFKGK